MGAVAAWRARELEDGAGEYEKPWLHACVVCVYAWKVLACIVIGCIGVVPPLGENLSLRMVVPTREGLVLTCTLSWDVKSHELLVNFTVSTNS